MQITDLLFLAAAAATVVVACRVAWRLAFGPRASVTRIVGRWAVGAACYATALLGASWLQPGRVIPVGENECFDDWCIAVTGVEHPETVETRRPSGTWLAVTLRISNRGEGRPQAEPDAYVYLRDADGREVQATAASDRDAPSIGEVVAVGQPRIVRVMFDVPKEMAAPALVKARRSRFPGLVIIGDPVSVRHRPTMHQLSPPPAV